MWELRGERVKETFSKEQNVYAEPRSALRVSREGSLRIRLRDSRQQLERERERELQGGLQSELIALRQECSK